jgi:hypothetical protein
MSQVDLCGRSDTSAPLRHGAVEPQRYVAVILQRYVAASAPVEPSQEGITQR